MVLSCIGLKARSPRVLPPYGNIVRAFPPDVWISLLVAIILFSVVFYVSHEERPWYCLTYYRNIPDVIFFQYFPTFGSYWVETINYSIFRRCIAHWTTAILISFKWCDGNLTFCSSVWRLWLNHTIFHGSKDNQQECAALFAISCKLHVMSFDWSAKNDRPINGSLPV